MPTGSRAETSIFPTREDMQKELLKYIQKIIDDQIRFPGKRRQHEEYLSAHVTSTGGVF